jgi:hypothetical protein
MRAGSLEDADVQQRISISEKTPWSPGHLEKEQCHDGEGYLERPRIHSLERSSVFDHIAIWVAALGAGISYVHLGLESCSPIIATLPRVCAEVRSYDCSLNC